jgi:hypothetical protein
MSLYDERRSIESELVEKALTDEVFRKSLIADPKGTVEKEWGVSLPAAMTIQVHQETRDQLHVVLPAAASASSELSSNELLGHSKWGHFIECTVECTQCSNNDTTCRPGPTDEG